MSEELTRDFEYARDNTPHIKPRDIEAELLQLLENGDIVDIQTGANEYTVKTADGAIVTVQKNDTRTVAEIFASRKKENYPKQNETEPPSAEVLAEMNNVRVWVEQNSVIPLNRKSTYFFKGLGVEMTMPKAFSFKLSKNDPIEFSIVNEGDAERVRVKSEKTPIFFSFSIQKIAEHICANKSVNTQKVFPLSELTLGPPDYQEIIFASEVETHEPFLYRQNGGAFWGVSGKTVGKLPFFAGVLKDGDLCPMSVVEVQADRGKEREFRIHHPLLPIYMKCRVSEILAHKSASRGGKTFSSFEMGPDDWREHIVRYEMSAPMNMVIDSSYRCSLLGRSLYFAEPQNFWKILPAGQMFSAELKKNDQNQEFIDVIDVSNGVTVAQIPLTTFAGLLKTSEGGKYLDLRPYVAKEIMEKIRQQSEIASMEPEEHEQKKQRSYDRESTKEEIENIKNKIKQFVSENQTITYEGRPLMYIASLRVQIPMDVSKYLSVGQAFNLSLTEKGDGSETIEYITITNPITNICALIDIETVAKFYGQYKSYRSLGVDTITIGPSNAEEILFMHAMIDNPFLEYEPSNKLIISPYYRPISHPRDFTVGMEKGDTFEITTYEEMIDGVPRLYCRVINPVSRIYQKFTVSAYLNSPKGQAFTEFEYGPADWKERVWKTYIDSRTNADVYRTKKDTSSKIIVNGVVFRIPVKFWNGVAPSEQLVVTYTSIEEETDNNEKQSVTYILISHPTAPRSIMVPLRDIINHKDTRPKDMFSLGHYCDFYEPSDIVVQEDRGKEVQKKIPVVIVSHRNAQLKNEGLEKEQKEGGEITEAQMQRLEYSHALQDPEMWKKFGKEYCLSYINGGVPDKYTRDARVLYIAAYCEKHNLPLPAKICSVPSACQVDERAWQNALGHGFLPEVYMPFVCNVDYIADKWREIADKLVDDQGELLLSQTQIPSEDISSDMRQLPFKDNSFDLVSASAINSLRLPNLTVDPFSRVLCVGEFNRVCKDGGFVSIIEHGEEKPLNPLESTALRVLGARLVSHKDWNVPVRLQMPRETLVALYGDNKEEIERAQRKMYNHVFCMWKKGEREAEEELNRDFCIFFKELLLAYETVTKPFKTEEGETIAEIRQNAQKAFEYIANEWKKITISHPSYKDSEGIKSSMDEFLRLYISPDSHSDSDIASALLEMDHTMAKTEILSQLFSFLTARAKMRRDNHARLDNIDKFLLYQGENIEKNRHTPLQERDAQILAIWAREMNRFVRLAHTID